MAMLTDEQKARYETLRQKWQGAEADLREKATENEDLKQRLEVAETAIALNASLVDEVQAQYDRAEQAEDKVRGFEAMKWPEEAHRLQQRLNEAEREREQFDDERLDAVVKLKAINTFLIDFGTFGQNDQAIWEYLNHGTPLPVKEENDG